jgi:signal transduction histidine kinase
MTPATPATAGQTDDDELLWRADGSNFPVEFESRAVMRGGRVAGAVVLFRDISERRKQQRLLRDQAASLAELARFPDMNPAPVVRVSQDGKVLMANRAALAVFGRDLIGCDWLAVCPGMSAEFWARVHSTAEVVRHETGMAGREFVLTHRCDPLSKLVFVYGADVTELKAAQGELSRQSAALAEVARFPDMNPGPVLRAGQDGKVLMANRAAHAVFGANLIGLSWPDTCPGMTAHGWESIKASPSIVAHEARTGEREYVFSHRCDSVSGLVFIFGADVTELKAAQRALQQAEKLAALGKMSAGLAHELNNPAAAAKRAAAQMKERLAGIERELARLGEAGLGPGGTALLTDMKRQIAGSAGKVREMGALERADVEDTVSAWLDARGVSEPWQLAPKLLGLGTEGLERAEAALSKGALAPALAWLGHSAEAEELVTLLSTSTTAISELVAAVKSYTHMDRAPQQEFDLHDGIESTIRILSHKLKAGTRLERSYDRTIPRLFTYGGELNQVWTNLIDNAIDAAGPNGIVTVRTTKDGAEALIEVLDDGPGVPASLQQRVFEPFFTTKEVGKGTGLGLDVARRIVTERCRGNIGFMSSPGDTVFWVRLPLAGGPAARS